MVSNIYACRALSNGHDSRKDLYKLVVCNLVLFLGLKYADFLYLIKASPARLQRSSKTIDRLYIDGPNALIIKDI